MARVVAILSILLTIQRLHAAELLEISRAEVFETEVFASKFVWAVGFINSQRPNPEFEDILRALPAELPTIRFGMLDVSVADNSPIASELNVRKRTAPKLMLLTTRARTATEIKVFPEEGQAKLDDVVAAVKAALSKNKPEEENAKDMLLKITLAIGTGGEEL
eukprot:TRINITY_DN28986_c0_g1_i2.p1 TRINITY_DN28986_c0_g1~~TRINITY_DN28986_c0_g1_i2.p1  ORF type:complete len:163 (-),score=41.41 TRINITY_DN28986_c0_g1_i2:436-924(-)